jgi:2-amino-4-hydroxy-6-hydroxymethyldihydropteridine diphosphokinase
MKRAFIGIGTNVGDRCANVLFAHRALRRLPRTRVSASSGLYETPPQHVLEQPDYLNAAVCLETELEPAELLRSIKNIEREAGRSEAGVRFGPRVLDLDILLYGMERHQGG